MGEGKWCVVFFEKGVKRTRYRKTKEAAEALRENIEKMLESGGVEGAETIAKKKCKAPLTRAEWLDVIWEHIEALRSIERLDMMPVITDTIVKTYKVVRDDLAIIESKLGEPTDPTSLDDKTLKRRIAQLKSVGKAA